MTTRFRSWMTRLLAVVMASMALAIVGIPASPAQAADGCGSGYHKQSNGEMEGGNVKQAQRRKVTASIKGYVRFCTRERTFYDQRDQRVLLGVPEDFKAVATFVGGRSQRPCMSMSIVVHLMNIESASASGGFSWPAGVNVGWSVSYSGKTVRASYNFCASRISTQKLRILPPDGFKVSGDNKGCYVNPLGQFSIGCFVYPRVEKVVITVTASMKYRRGGTETSLIASHVETDLANRSRRHRSNDTPASSTRVMQIG